MRPGLVGPRHLISCEVEVTNVLDLRVAENREIVGLSILDMTSDVGDYGACHRIAQAAHQLELHRIIAPAATGMGETLALFERRLPADELPVLLDTLTWEGLPPDPRDTGAASAEGQSSSEGSRGDSSE